MLFLELWDKNLTDIDVEVTCNFWHVPLFQNLLDETLEKFPDVEMEVWSKIFYTEKNQVIGKLYIREKEVIIDDSTAPFEGKV